MAIKEAEDKDISIYDERFLVDSLQRRTAAAGFDRTSDYCKFLCGSIDEARIFHKSLNITYSRFFRDPLVFAILERRILPGLIHREPKINQIRIWSAGCSCGQEAYSIAIILNELLEATNIDIKTQIFATDISEEAISFAVSGNYSRDAIQNVKVKHLEKYFINTGGTYTVIDKLKQSVNFSAYDLLDQFTANPPESIYGNFDIVYCSNVLFYYKSKLRIFITDKIINSIKKSGYIITGEAENSCLSESKIVRRLALSVPIFQKHGCLLP